MLAICGRGQLEKREVLFATHVASMHLHRDSSIICLESLGAHHVRRVGSLEVGSLVLTSVQSQCTAL